MPRYLPIQLDAANEEIRRVYAEVEKAVGFVPNYIKTVAHSPNCLKQVADLFCALESGESGLTDKLRALVALKTAKLDKCKASVERYAAAAKEAGVSEEQIKAMDGDFNEGDTFNHYEKDALQLAESLLRAPDDISQTQFWTQLDNHFTSDQVVEMITLIGFVNMMDRFLLAVEVAPDTVPV